MAIREEEIPEDIRERAQATADMLERKLLKAVDAADTELARVIRNGEADFDRLARRIAETLAQLAIDSAFGAGSGDARSEGRDAGASLNRVATAVARAARRGSRFT